MFPYFVTAFFHEAGKQYWESKYFLLIFGQQFASWLYQQQTSFVWVESFLRFTISALSIVALATIGPLEYSTRIDRRGGIIEVAFATKMSVVTTRSCAVDGLNPTVVYEAASAPSSGGPSAADRHFVRRARPGRKSLDIAQKPVMVEGGRMRTKVQKN